MPFPHYQSVALTVQADYIIWGLVRDAKPPSLTYGIGIQTGMYANGLTI